MKWASAVLILLAATYAVTLRTHKSPGQFGGTFIGAVVADDGIVIGADSRSTFVDASGRKLGYVDRIQKVYVEHGAAIAVAGLISVDDELFSTFMSRNNHLLARPANEVLSGVALKLPMQNTSNILLLSAGYVNEEGIICAKAPLEPQSCRKSGYVANKTSTSLRRWLEAQKGRVPSSSEAAAALDQAIQEAADLDSTIGGPTTLLLVPKSGPPKWLKNSPSDNGWKRICDVVTAYRNGRTMIFFTNTKDELDRFLSAACPK